MNVDEKLLKNVLDEANRLNSQLNDLEIYKEDFEIEEYNQIKEDTFNQLVVNAKIIDNMSKGNLKTLSTVEEARKKITDMIVENYNVKQLMGTYLSGEVYYLRANLQKIISQYSIGKISSDDYQLQVGQLLAAIGKVSELNKEEQQLNDDLKDNVILSKYSKDVSIKSDKIESKLKANN